MPGVDWAGTIQLSWWELKQFIRNMRQDKTSAFYRALHPEDWMWADVDTLLLAEIATAVTDLRWMEVMARLGDEDEVPEHWRLRQFGPPTTALIGDSEDGPNAVEEARDVAAGIRGG